MIEYYGDFLRGATLRIPLNSLLSSGALTAITSPAVAVVRGGSVLTPSGGVSLSGSAGVYEVVVDTSVDPATFVKGDYSLRLSAGTVNGVSVAGYWLAAFSLENRSVAPQTGDAYARIGAAGAGLTAIGPVTLASSQPNYAPATAAALASLVTTVGAAGAGLTGLPPVTLAASQPGYTPATAAALASLASTVGTAGDGLTAIPRDGYRLAADGLDAIATTEPTVASDGEMSTWTFPQLLRWLVARFGRASKTPTALTVSTLAGSPSTVQALTDDGAGNESTGAPS